MNDSHTVDEGHVWPAADLVHLICVQTGKQYVDSGCGVQLVSPAPALPQAVVYASLVASSP